MRALRRIVFINSANIRYGEIKLDGNVHFTGTQGVGKSTLLRAILFFYNADKAHLGIPREKRSFDDFYLPTDKSYIIYEVEHEAGPFSILVFRYEGRACYRFIDAPFSRDWIMDETGNVITKAPEIRKRLNGAFMSSIVRRYDTYKDIIYGGGTKVGSEFTRFQLIQTRQYQNIPLSIQNVFLNSRLDANFIKDIIIRSMSEVEPRIDLSAYYDKIVPFEQEYKDISVWFETNSKGECPVRKHAEAVRQAYHELLFAGKRIASLSGELKYAVRQAEESIPQLTKESDALTEKMDRERRLHNETQQKYDNEKTTLNRKLGLIDGKLGEVKKQREYYTRIGIESIMEHCSKEPSIKAELAGWKERLTSLLATFNDISTKYKALKQDVKNQFETFRQAQKERVLLERAEKQKRDERYAIERRESQAEIDRSFKERIESATLLVESILISQKDCEKELVRLEGLTPYKTEIDTLRAQLHNIALKRKELEGKVKALAGEISALIAKEEKEEAAIKTEFQRKREAKETEITRLNERIASLDETLSRTKGSLFEWLEENKPDWERHIGKVIDEDAVLFRTGLHPELSEGDSLFGVKIDLSDLPVNIRKPKELLKEKTELEREVNTLRQALRTLIEEEEKAVKSLQNRFTPKIKEIREQKSITEVEIDSLPGEEKAIQLQILQYENKAKAEKEERLSVLKTREQQLSNDLSEAKDQLAKLNSEKLRRLDAAERRFRDQTKESEKRLAERVAAINQETQLSEENFKREHSRLENEETEELAGRGADTRLREECRQKIAALENALSFIEHHREDVFNYKRDKAELFDKEESFKSERKTILDKLRQLLEKHESHRKRHEEELSRLGGELRECRERLKSIEEDLRKADRFIHDGNLCPAMYPDAPETETLKTAGETVESLTDVIISREGKKNQFKQAVNLFKSHFTSGNVFHFRMDLSTDEDYMDFASNLDNFMINNLVETYRDRSSEHYADILVRITKELGDLTRHESDVRKVILDINGDFQARNFVGVIKEISLRSVGTSDRLVQLLHRIKEFYQENPFNVGELNLFSSAGSGDVNRTMKRYLLDLARLLSEDPSRKFVSLSDLFELQFRVVENDNDTGWTEKISHVGSEGTDTLVKAMINIMLINVFKEKVSRKFGEFRIHCMMDEIGKLHYQNVKGILNFANARNILLINSSPDTNMVSEYRHTYVLEKDGRSKTKIHPILSTL